MRKVIVSNIASVDGFTADQEGSPLVLNMDAAFDAYNLERIRSADLLLLGRRSFEMFSAYWPFVAEAPEDPGNRALNATNREISRIYNRLPKVVISDKYTVPEDHPWSGSTTVVARQDAASWLKGARSDGEGDILVFGSGTMWSGLLTLGQVDELHIMVSPHALGTGTPAFTSPVDLQLKQCRRFDGSDNVLLAYAVARPNST